MIIIELPYFNWFYHRQSVPIFLANWIAYWLYFKPKLTQMYIFLVILLLLVYSGLINGKKDFADLGLIIFIVLATITINRVTNHKRI